MRRPIVIGFEGDEPDWEWIEAAMPAGVILFQRNLKSPRQIRDLNERLAALPSKPFLTVDLEGGPVNRFRHILGEFPGPMDLADGDLISEAGRILGRMLLSFGFHVDLAPVVDIDFGNRENGLANRTWGRDAETVVDRATAFLRGLTRGGVAGCLKHFPGLGTTIPDSHMALPEYQGDEDSWNRNEGKVYRRLSAEFANTPIMLAHCRVPFWGQAISSVSNRCVGWLRNRGFRGIIMTDDMEMHALDQDLIGEFAIQARRAGADVLLVCRQRRQVDRVIEALDRSDLGTTDDFERRVDMLIDAQGKDHRPELESAEMEWRAFSQGFIGPVV